MAHAWHVEQWGYAERRPPSPRSAWFGLALAVLCAASYVVALVIPYYSGGMQTAPHEEMWVPDPTAAWPYETALDLPIGLAGVFAVSGGPFLAAGTLWWSGRTLWVHRGQLTSLVRGVLVATVLVSVAILAWLPTPMAGRVFSWFVD